MSEGCRVGPVVNRTSYACGDLELALCHTHRVTGMGLQEHYSCTSLTQLRVPEYGQPFKVTIAYPYPIGWPRWPTRDGAVGEPCPRGNLVVVRPATGRDERSSTQVY